MFPENSAVIVAHGARADGSGWKEVILPLSKQGLQVFAVPLPLTSLNDDIAALNRTIGRTKGPVIVAGARLCRCSDCGSKCGARKSAGLCGSTCP